MLKALTARCSSHVYTGAHLRGHAPAGVPASPLMRVLRGQKERSPCYLRRFSDSSDGNGPVDSTVSESKYIEVGEEAAESKSSSAIVPTVVRPEDCLTVIALPLLHRPLFPGFYMPIYVKDQKLLAQKLLAALVESKMRQAPYTGAFLLKDEEGAKGSDTDKNICDLKGKDLLKRVHEVGTLAQTSIQGDQVVLIGHSRLRITEMVSEDPLTVKVDHLKEKSSDKDDDILKATSFDVIATLRDVLKTSPLWRDHAQTYTQALTARCSSHVDIGAHLSGHSPAGVPASPLLRVLRGQKGRSPFYLRRFLCSDSSGGNGLVDSTWSETKYTEVGEEAAESKSSSAIVPTVVRPEDCLTVIALPLLHRPLFTGLYMPSYVKDQKLAALVESKKKQAPYTGAFLLKDEEGAKGSDTDKNIYDLKGNDLLKCLHEVGTLAQNTSIQGEQVVFMGHIRLRITEMVSEDPLTVKVDHLKEKPFDKDDDILKATSFEVIATPRDVLKTSPLWRDHAQTYTQAITARCSSHVYIGAHLRGHAPARVPASPLLRVLRGQKGRSLFYLRRFLCSDSSDGNGLVDSTGSETKYIELGEEAAESKSSSAIVPTVVRPEDCLTVIALPLLHRPLFPGFHMPIYVKDQKLLAALVESKKKQAPYTGAFLLKDEEGAKGSDTDENIYDLKGKDLLKRLHEVGTLAQITSIQRNKVVLIGHRRLRITEMVIEDPLTVKVDHLKETPFDKDDDILKATSFEVIATPRDVSKTSPLWRDHAQTYTQLNRFSTSASSDNEPSRPDESPRLVVFNYFKQLPMCMVCLSYKMTYADQILKEKSKFVSDRVPEVEFSFHWLDRPMKKYLGSDYEKPVYAGEPPHYLKKLSDDELIALLTMIAKKMLKIFPNFEKNSAEPDVDQSDPSAPSVAYVNFLLKKYKYHGLKNLHLSPPQYCYLALHLHDILAPVLREKFFSQDTLGKKFSRDQFKDMIQYRGKTKFVEMEKNVYSFIETCAIFDGNIFPRPSDRTTQIELLVFQKGEKVVTGELTICDRIQTPHFSIIGYWRDVSRTRSCSIVLARNFHVLCWFCSTAACLWILFG